MLRREVQNHQWAFLFLIPDWYRMKRSYAGKFLCAVQKDQLLDNVGLLLELVMVRTVRGSSTHGSKCHRTLTMSVHGPIRFVGPGVQLLSLVGRMTLPVALQGCADLFTLLSVLQFLGVPFCSSLPSPFVSTLGCLVVPDLTMGSPRHVSLACPSSYGSQQEPQNKLVLGIFSRASL